MRRGSALLFTLAAIGGLAIVLVGLIPFVRSIPDTNARRRERILAEQTFEAAMAKLVADSQKGQVALLIPRVINMNGVTGSLTPYNNAAEVSGTLKANATLTYRGKTYTFSRVIGARKARNPFIFALYSESSLNSSLWLRTGIGGDKGDVYVKDNADLSSGTVTVNGTIEAKGTLKLPTNASVTGDKVSGSREIPWPSTTDATYLAVATTTHLTGQSFNNYTFPNPIAGIYPLVYINGNTTLRGSISGVGTIYVKGDLTISNTLSYANSNSRVALIATGKVIVKSSANSVVGYIYSGSDFVAEPSSLTLTSGCLAVKKVATASSLDLTLDTSVRSDPAEGSRLKLPGLWP